MDNLKNIEAEQSVIGGVLLCYDSIEAIEAVEILKPSDFYLSEHKEYWKAIREMSGKNQCIDILTITDHMDAHQVGYSRSYIGEMAKNTPSQASVVNYAKIVKNMSRLRDAMKYCVNAINELNAAGEPEERISKALGQVSSIGADESDGDIKDPVDVLSDVLTMMEKAFSSESGMVGISSGFENIDRFTNGFQAPDVIIVAAPPSMGKTTFSLNFAEYAAFLDPLPKNVLVFSLEMSAQQLMQKTIANLGSLYLNKIKTGKALEHHADVARIAQAQEIISRRRKHFRIDDKGGQSIGDIQARAKRTSMKMGGLDLIVVDYLHLIEPSSSSDSDIQTLTKNIKGLKNLAKQLNCPVIVLSQLNRGFTGRPEMKNLLGSSIIEQAADIIFFLYDEDYQGERNNDSITEVIVAKNRMGETGSTYLQPELAMSRFADTKRLPQPKQDDKPSKKFKRYDE
jgi:replicative DNA helicase